jgi:circadian clock protein KaiB
MTSANSSPDKCRLRLYVSAATPNSSNAIVNIRSFCERFLPGQYELEILTISENVPQAALDQVVAAPTLIRLWPMPVRRFIGDMSNSQRLLQGLAGNMVKPAGAG